MRTLLNDLRHVATPMEIASKEEMVQAIKAAHVALLRCVALNEDPRFLESIPWLRRYALWLEDIAISGDVVSQELRGALNVAATLYEFCGGLTPDEDLSVFLPPLNDLMRGAILNSLANQPAHAALLARRARQKLSARE